MDWNQARENVLAGAAWLGGAGAGGAEVIEQLRKPTALICSSRGAERIALAGGRAKRDELLIEMIKSAVARGGTVLIPTDSSARVLELAYLLEHTWRTEIGKDDSPLKLAKLYLASKTAGATMRYTRSMLEWMDDGIVREFEAVGGAQQANEKGRGAGPFDFKHLRLLERKGQIDRVLRKADTESESPRGKVILASDTSLNWGFSKDVLRSIAGDDRSLIILTERQSTPQQSSAGTGIAQMLWYWWEERKDGVASEAASNGVNLEQIYGGGREVEVHEAKRVALEGNDLAAYQQWLATQRQLQTTLQPSGATNLESSADAVDDASSESSSDSEGSQDQQQGKALNISTALGQANRKKIGLTDEDLGINILIRRKGVYDYDVRGKKGREKMFPMIVRRKRTDDFGDLIRPEEYLRAEERDEIDGEDMRQAGKYDTQDTLGKKRKWNDISAAADRRLSSSSNKRQQLNRSGAQADGMDFQGIGDEAAAASDDDEDEETEEEVTGPSKVVYATESFKLNLRLAFIDFAGLHDKRSLHMLIPLIQPRKLILVGGVKDETLALASDCQRLLAAQSGSSSDTAIDVFSPEIGISVDASVDTNAWVVKLTDDLVKRLKWQNVRGLGIVTLTGSLAGAREEHEESEEQDNARKKQKMLKGEAEDSGVVAIQGMNDATVTNLIPILDIVPTNMASATRSVAQPLHVGDLRLADLRKILQSSGHTAEFRGEGTLLIDSCVAVRKTGTGRIEVESSGLSAYGGSSPQNIGAFYAVKKKIYEGLAVVAGG